MKDLIARLREACSGTNYNWQIELHNEAADAIESLDAALEAAQQLAMSLGDELNAKDAEIERLKCVVDGLETLSLQRDGEYLVEIERLTAELAQLKASLPDDGYYAIKAERDALHAEVKAWIDLNRPGGEIDALREDAERYRWLRYGPSWPSVFPDSEYPEPLRGEDLDAAIDAARKA